MNSFTIRIVLVSGHKFLCQDSATHPVISSERQCFSSRHKFSFHKACAAHLVTCSVPSAHPVTISIPTRTVLLIRSPFHSSQRTVLLIRSQVQFPEGQCCSFGHKFSSQKDNAAHPVTIKFPEGQLLIRSPVQFPAKQCCLFPTRSVLLILSPFQFPEGLSNSFGQHSID
jgi:hypothetical protein